MYAVGMHSIKRIYPFLHKIDSVESIGKRPFWAWLNIIFNRIDDDRRKKYGPDRTCAEWLLRNGASVKFCNGDKYLSDYNTLPLESTKFHIEEVDATDSSIMHYGFGHFIGCKFIKKITFHKCMYLENEALGMVTPLKDSLSFLQISGCYNINEEGLKKLDKLDNLKTLKVFDLPYLKDQESVVSYLQSHLPSCNVDIVSKEKKESIP